MCLARHSIGHPGAQSGKFPGPTQPPVFTFEPFPERLCKLRPLKKRPRRVLYPPQQVRKSVPKKKDVTKRLLLFFLSIVLFQVYTATEDELSLPTPDLSASVQVSVPIPPPSCSPDSGVLSVMYLPAFAGAESNYTQQ
ncbi:radiation-inducible immediate-early gene IEX-1-like [Carcharodon carcharias]|uniref:radiation-inducible immediate-early gene IEX-1-like n=1 Tax=Carcharodon carcharias TaxID=13397 RepID=UPI001B7DE64E|nr:radiation-inducible immediate-early gene IEX-1-like [Carcharodon carcharias]